VQVYGTTWKVLIQEVVGDGIMSAIDLDITTGRREKGQTPLPLAGRGYGRIGHSRQVPRPAGRRDNSSELRYWRIDANSV